MKALHCLIVAATILSACSEFEDSTTDAVELKSRELNNSYRPSRIGVILTSHGDIDEFEEIEGYLRTAFLKNVGVPLPGIVRRIVENPAYWIAKGGIEEQYEIIGATEYRKNADIQAKALRRALWWKGINANVYVGYNFMPPFVEDAIKSAREDGVEEVVVFNKGAQYSLATLGESIEEIEGYLEDATPWDARIVAVRQFSDDERFRKLFARVLRRDALATFPGKDPSEICLMVASHGLPLRLIRMGDPAVTQMLDVVEDLKRRLPEFPMYHAFLNDDFFPGAAWVEPNSGEVSEEIRKDGCTAILMDGRLSFTTHHRATLFDLDVDARDIIENQPDLLSDGSVDPAYEPPTAVLAQQWDDEPAFARLMADLTVEALRGEGDIIEIQ
ncbi:MAG: ferrochelatase [Myxococcota bacterium]|nr:ferrochelatase [Myxococcota bacterium]